MKVNLLLRDFIAAPPPPARWRRARRAVGKRALFVSSPIGLGHARRDVAIARELRRLHPDLEIDWLAQHPVTARARGRGRAHPPRERGAGQRVGPHRVRVARARPALRSRRCGGWTRSSSRTSWSSTTSCASRQYDLWIGDEAWEVDYFLHENPELKTAAYVWLTDFVGWLPMPDGGEREALPRRRLQRRDGRARRALPAGSRSVDLRRRARTTSSPTASAPGCPRSASGPSSTSSSPATSPASTPAGSATATRCARSSGYGDDEQVCVVVGRRLGRRVELSAARDRAASRRPSGSCPSLRMIVVAGPRIDPDSLVSGAARRRGPRGPRLRPRPAPPPRRLRPRDRAGRADHDDGADREPDGRSCTSRSSATSSRTATSRTGSIATAPAAGWSFADSPPDVIAAAIAQEIGREVDYLPVGADGAARAAASIAELL